MMAVVCGSWWLCVGHGGCVRVMMVVCGSWWLCVSDGGCVVVVCVSRERYLRIPSYVKVPITSDVQG